MWTRAQYVEETRAAADATDSDRWTSDTVLRTLALVHQREWRGILSASAYYRWAERSVSSDASGVVDLADLDSGSGDSQERLYRVIAVATRDGATEYEEVDYDQVRFATHRGGGAPYLYWREGATLRVLPAEATDLLVVVNHTPTPLGSLANDDSQVEFPRDYELLVCYEAAALLLAKGGAETEATSYLKGLAREMRTDLLADVARLSTNPTRVKYGDSYREWGGH